MAKPDIDGLKDFIETEDRERARFFVGREKEIEAVEALCRKSMKAAVPGATTVIQGAPGAGKTSILREMEKRWKKSYTAIPVRVNRSGLGSEAETVTQIVRQVFKWIDREWRTTETESVGGGLRLPFAGIEAENVRSILPERPSFSALRHALPPERWERPVALLVDEIQNVDMSALDVLEALHLATDDLPVVPVYAGLGNSERRLDDILSRLVPENVHDIGCLPKKDVHLAFDRMMDGFRIGMDGANTSEWKTWLVDMSDGWPQHMHNAMRALAVGLVGTGGRLAAVSVEWVHRDALDRKQKAYSRRCSQDIIDAGMLVSGLMAELKRRPRGLEKSEIVIHLNKYGQAFRNEDTKGYWLPQHGDAGRFADHLIRRGILQRRTGENPKGLHHCPIPTLRDYILKEWPIDVPALEPPQKALLPGQPVIPGIENRPVGSVTGSGAADITERATGGDRPRGKVPT